VVRSMESVEAGSDGDDADRKEKRRQRLAALRGKRNDDSANAVVAAPVSPKANRGEFGLGGGRKAAKGGNKAVSARLGGDDADNEARRKAIARVVRLLTDTPADASGMVPDTPFSKAGVVRLMEMLRERAANPTAPGGKVAGGLMKFMSAKEGEAEVHGASLEKLQRAAKMVGRRGSNRGGGQGGRRAGAKKGRRSVL
jgi:hypothetical protein